MKLARKLTLAILAVMVAVLTLNAVERVKRDRAALREDVQRDHRSLGHALQVVVLESFKEDGEERALRLVEAANERESGVQISWHWLPEGALLPGLSQRQRTQLREGRDVDVVRPRDGVAWLSSFYPVRLPDGRRGVIEVGESLAAESEAVKATLMRAGASTFLIALLAALVAHVLGIWLVGRPIARLMEKARRVGAGDLSGPIELSQPDELADLAREMNAMCERLDTETRARQQALEQLRHAERLATVGRLAAGVAHELGTPLQVITLEAKRIAVGRAEGPAAREGASVVASQAERMASIIRQLLDFARRRTPRPTAVDLGELVQSTLVLLGAVAARQQIELRHVEEQSATAYVDAEQLKQVLTNLVINAIQATPNGGEIEVITGIEPVEEAPELCAFVRVRDSGVGMSEDVLPRIFEPFFTTKDVGQGTGLGLAVAHGIVEEHSGRIEVDSKAGHGTSFTVRLPVRQTKEAA